MLFCRKICFVANGAVLSQRQFVIIYALLCGDKFSQNKFCGEEITNMRYASKYKFSRTDNTDFNLPGLKQDLIREHLHLQQQTLSESWLNLG